MHTNANVRTSPSKGYFFPVEIVEEFPGRAPGVKFTRAVTKTGQRIVAKSHLFVKDEKGARVSFDQIREDVTLETGLSRLREKWAKS